MTSQTVLFIFGGLLTVAGIFGGGFAVKEIRIPTISGFARISSLVAGVVLIGAGFALKEPSPPPSFPIAEPAPRPPAPVPTPSRIAVVAATYGQNCKAPHGNVTDDIASKCNGRETCEYEINYNIIGDPVPGCQKEYLAEWKCGDDPTVHSELVAGEAGLSRRITLACK